MSGDRNSLDAAKVFQTTVEKLKAFGYVDRNWVLSAYAAFYRKEQERNARKAEEKPGVWARVGKFLAGLIGAGAPKEPDRFAYLNQNKDGRESLRLLQSLLAQIPSPAPVLQGQRSPRRAAARRPLEEIVAKADPDQAQLVARFLRKSGLEETGFPVRLIGEKGEGAEPADAAANESVGPANRNAALSTLTGGLLYRFAYDHDKKLKWEDTRKVFRAEGLYRVYVVPPDATYIERRLLLVSLIGDGAIVRAAEIRKRRNSLVVRGGYVIPAAGINTFVLSSDFSPDVLAEMIETGISPAAREIVFPDGVPAEAETSASFLQEHQLGFYSLFSRGEGELRGSLMEAPTPASAVGYRVDPAQIDLREPGKAAIARPDPVSESFSDAPDIQPPSTPELGFLTLEEIEDRRDQILVAAISRNPAVSIDIG
jgi:hypothetical protein